jgi:Predicted membrane protein (DUF2232)
MRDSSAMDTKSGQVFDVKYPVAVGAGLASALLCLVARQGTLPAASIAFFSPLPILIATLGFGPFSGLGAVAVGVGAIIAYAASRPIDIWTIKLIYAAFLGGSFAVMIAVPAWWLGRIGRLGRSDEGSWRDSKRKSGPQPAAGTFYPLSRLLSHAVLLSCTTIVVFLTAIAWDAGGYDAMVERLTAKVGPYILEIAGPRELPAGMDLHDLSRLYVRLFPPLLTSGYFALTTANLWLAGRIVQLSNLLVRPWPDIVRDLRLPRPFAFAFLACCAVSLLVGGFIGMVAACAAAAIGMGFMLQGLAVIHFLTRAVKYRRALLAAIYVAAAFMTPLMFVPFAAMGLLDAGFSFRDRRIVAAPQKP